MSLNDPFSTTYEGSYKSGLSLGQGIGQAASSAADVISKKNQGQATQNMLKQFGILTEKEKPYSIDEIKDIAQKQFGTDININSTMSENKQVETATKLLDSMGIKLPKRTTPEVNLDRAAKMGMVYKPDMFGGEVAFAPKKPEKTLLEQITEAKTAEEAGLEIKGGKVQTKGAGGFGAAQIQFAKELAPKIAEQMKRGEVAGYLKSTRQTQTAVAAQLADEGINIDDLVLGYGGEQAAMGNAKIQDQKVNAANSAKALLDSSYDSKTGEWKVPPSMHVELALSVARLLSATGQIPYEMVQELRQKTAREQFASMAIFLGADPKEVGGSTQDVIKLFSKTIEREALASQAMRDKYFQGKFSKFGEYGNAGKNVAQVTGLTPTEREITATNPNTGEKLIYRGGAWQKI